MSRPEITVVMPFAGTPSAAQEALDGLRSLDVQTGDELILVDNSGTVPALPESGGGDSPEVVVVAASRERSPAHARNVGAARARNEWILFLDADARPRPGLLAAFWGDGIPGDVGAVAGEIVPDDDAATLAGRYGAARSFLGVQAHLEHPYRPRAAAANLLVRRAAFEQLGGFYEGVRAAEDTDFSWRLQEAGWRLSLREQAQVEHRYRTSLSELRRQWRGYAAGRAWLARRYDSFVPEPALRRAMRRGRVRLRRGGHILTRADSAPPGTEVVPPASDPRSFFALDALLAVEELAGLTLSNRPRGGALAPSSPVAVVLFADRFPERDDPLVELADSLDRVRVEAVGRPLSPDPVATRRLTISYLEDDGSVGRLGATSRLILRHPWRCLCDLLQRSRDEPRLSVLAPAVGRLGRDSKARLHALGGGRTRATAERLARLAGRPLD